MNISYNWLKDLIDLGLSVEETAAALTRVGLAVEGIETHGDDSILDVDITSNRSDCLSHLGIARELSVITERPLKMRTKAATAADVIDINAIPFPSVLAPEVVRIDASDLCSRFTARIIRNVKVGPSPKWLVDRLESVGERSINNIADITNYVMLELGQPMHAFDLDVLAGNRLVVRRAKDGETITTLDEVERKLDETMLVICDAESPAAVAGIMGGIHSGITDDTVNVLLEVAYFDRDSIRQTSRKLGLSTEASYRFERGVDIENLIRASDRAAELIVELAGGEAAEIVDIYPNKYRPAAISSQNISAATARLSGVDVDRTECLRLLNALGVGITRQNETFNEFIAPSWRHDISIEEDLVEEIIRHHGYEQIEEKLPPAFGAGEYQPGETARRSIRRSLASMGFDEAMSYSFIQAAFDGVFTAVPTVGSQPITLQAAVIDGAVRMRQTMLPGLLDAVRNNFNHQRRNIKLFEIGRVFGASASEPADERELIAIVMTGTDESEGRLAAGREVDFYDLKGAVETIFTAAGIGNVSFSAGDVVHLRRGQAAVVEVNGIPVGYLGKIKQEIADDYKFKQAVYVGEIDLQTVLAQKAAAVNYRPLPRFPAVVRDVSLMTKRSLPFADITDAVRSIAGELFRSVAFVDIYEGKGIAADERSLTIRLEYRSDDRTLTEDEVNAEHERIISGLESRLGIKPRF